MRWHFMEANEEERRTLSQPDLLLEQAPASALPGNRLREVRTVEIAGRTCYLKIFRRTQPKNRLRAWTTPPRAHTGCDGEREALVTAALRARGVLSPRPIAWGRRGGRSYYLCAPLPGRPLRQVLEQSGPDRALVDRAARYCGTLLRTGAALPDLSADHLFVQDDGSFGVLDLTNGRVSHRPASRRDLRRVLRRFGKSVRGIGVPRPTALRFAALLARRAGHAPRPILRRLPPWDTHGRYEVPGKSGAYRNRNPARARREVALLARIWPGRPGDRVLDLPCGTGRLRPLVEDTCHGRWLGADRAAAMLAEARDIAPQARLVRTDAAAIGFADRALEGIIVFRFLHHLPPEQARSVVAEAARIADRWIVVSFFHPLSAHGLRRRLLALLTGRRRTRWSLWPRTLGRWLADAGFAAESILAEGRYRRDFWVASYRRHESAPGPDSTP